MAFEYTPEITDEYLQKLRRPIEEEGETAVAKARGEALRRGMTGDPFEALRVGTAEAGTRRALADVESGLAFNIAGLKREERLAKESQAYQSSEAEKGRLWQTGETEKTRGFQSTQAEIERSYGAGEAEKSRSFQSAEALAQRGFAGTEAEKERTWKSAQDEAARIFEAGQTAEKYTFAEKMAQLEHSFNRDIMATQNRYGYQSDLYSTGAELTADIALSYLKK